MQICFCNNSLLSVLFSRDISSLICMCLWCFVCLLLGALFFFNLYRVFVETVFKVVNEEHDKLEAKKKAKHQNSITGE